MEVMGSRKFLPHKILAIGKLIRKRRQSLGCCGCARICNAVFGSADVIKIGHHGSKTSSSLKFLKAVGAKYAVISAGDHYNMVSIYPNKEVADRLNLLGVQYFVTKDLGTIRFSISSNGVLKVPRKSDLKEAA